MPLETLVIRLLAPAVSAVPKSIDGSLDEPSIEGSSTHSAAQWLLVDAQGARLGAALQGSLHEAAGLAAGRKLIVLVPGADALQLEPVLPPMKGGAKLNQIVPYALEDQLATDVDALHFAVGKREAGPGTPVIVVSHDAMQAWVFALRAEGLQADAIYTDSSLLPVTPQGITVLIDQGRVSLKPYNGPVTTLDVSPLSDALQILLPDEPLVPLVVYISEAEYDAEQATLDALRQRISDVQIKLLPDGVLPLLALQAARLTGINLLQGVYTLRTNQRSNTAPWRYAAALLVGLVAAHLVVKGFELSRLRKQEAALDRQIALTYSTAMPGAAPVRISEARHAFEERLLQLQAAAAGNGLMLGLSTLTDAVAKSPQLQLDAVSYRDKNIDLRLMAPSVDVLEGIRQQAMSRGVSAEIQSANPKDNRIEGRLQLKLQQGA
jgi:general secretion pathway protein L